MKFIQVTLHDGTEIVGEVIREEDSKWLCSDENNLMFDVEMWDED